MYTGLIGPNPFMAALLIIIFLSKGLSKVSSASSVNKVLAVPWGIYIYLLSQNNENSFAVIMSSIFQIFFVYWYLKIFHYLEDKVFADLIFLIIGAFALAFLNVFIYTIFTLF